MEEGQVETKKERMSAWKIILLVVVGLFIVGSLLPEPSPEEQAALDAEKAAEAKAELAKKSAAAQAEAATATEISSIELTEAFEANEVAAQLKFGDKPILITGNVDGVALDLTDDPVVKLPGTNRYLPVGVRLDDKEAAAALQKGQPIKALCQRLIEVAGVPQLGDCVLVN